MTHRERSWKPGNLKAALRRRERTLTNSMAHIPKPRPADMIRWRAMAAEIAELRLAVERQEAAKAAYEAEDPDHAPAR